MDVDDKCPLTIDVLPAVHTGPVQVVLRLGQRGRPAVPVYTAARGDQGRERRKPAGPLPDRPSAASSGDQAPAHLRSSPTVRAYNKSKSNSNSKIKSNSNSKSNSKSKSKSNNKRRR